MGIARKFSKLPLSTRIRSTVATASERSSLKYRVDLTSFNQQQAHSLLSTAEADVIGTMAPLGTLGNGQSPASVEIGACTNAKHPSERGNATNSLKLGSHDLETRILPISASEIQILHNRTSTGHGLPLEELKVSFSNTFTGASYLSEAAQALRDESIPVAFPTETVYGLGADATRSAAVRGIYAAKNRPADNPLIVHICSLQQLRLLLDPPASLDVTDSIPEIYHPLISRFWPGPLTILLPVPTSAQATKLAPEVTAGLSTFGARMPSSPLALALIHAADRPLAAPSANASTRPSPTRAEHVLHDLRGRIELILDGGACAVGVESTVVDGLSDPPAVLRPGGVSVEQLRRVPGWEGVVIAYKDEAEGGSGDSSDVTKTGLKKAPRAPGMKYKHYSPSARVVLVSAGLVTADEQLSDLIAQAAQRGCHRVGVLRSKAWRRRYLRQSAKGEPGLGVKASQVLSSLQTPEDSGTSAGTMTLELHQLDDLSSNASGVEVIDGSLGATPAEAAQNLFLALREMDLRKAGIIFVEGLDEDDEAAAAVMNRLKKAAEVKVNALPWRA